MKRTIIVNTNKYSTRIAVLEDFQVVELYFDNLFDRRIVGNIYKGIVTKVLPGMQASFVNIGLEKDAFLYVNDIYNNAEFLEHKVDDEQDDDPDLENQEEVEIVDAPEAAKTTNVNVSIGDILTEKQQLLIQIAKEPIDSKGARVTSHITLPGRFLVYMPTINHVGVSKKIETNEERERLRALLKELAKDIPGGFIVRTVGANRGRKEFITDIITLTKLWKTILLQAENAKPPYLLHNELDPVTKIIRDLLNSETDYLVIDSEEEYNRCLTYVNSIMPQYANKIKLHLSNTPIFEEYNIEKDVEQSLRRKIWLKSGGYIVIEQTEALVAIDVNTGKYVGKKDFEATITKINLEAAKEIVRQIRLRDLGGIIIIDFIDMGKQESKDKILKALETELEKDRSQNTTFPLSQLCLVEMTRKRVKKSIEKNLLESCFYCHGKGRIKSSKTLIGEIYRDFIKRTELFNIDSFILTVHPDLERCFYEIKDIIKELEDNLNIKIKVEINPDFHFEKYEIKSS